MPNPRCPYALWNPGVNAGYRAGRTTMTTAVAHYTVGRNSTPVGLQGYFHFLVARNGTIQQFCEADAVAWHAGDPWNSRGPGIEVEYFDEPEVFTDVQRDATSALVHWLGAEYGIPLAYYDGPRIGAHNGTISHRSLIQSGDAHSDYWPAADAAIIFGDDMPLSFDDLVNVGNTLEAVDGKDLAGRHVSNLYLLEELIGVKGELAKLQAASATQGPNVALLPSDLDAIATKVADKLAARLKD
jgi:hypothetical protein